MPRAVRPRIGRIRRIRDGSADGPVFDEPGGVHGPLGEHPPEREEIVLQRRPRQRLQRGPLDVGLIHHRLLLLEVEHGGPHLGVVGAGLVLACVHQALAREAFLHLREREPLRLEAQVLLGVAGGARVAAFGEGLQTVGAGGRAAPPAGEPRVPDGGPAPSAPCWRPTSGSDRRRAASPRRRRARSRPPRRSETGAAAPTARVGSHRAPDNFVRRRPAAGRRRRRDPRPARRTPIGSSRRREWQAPTRPTDPPR